jgi:hypothetical protein
MDTDTAPHWIRVHTHTLHTVLPDIQGINKPTCVMFTLSHCLPIHIRYITTHLTVTSHTCKYPQGSSLRTAQSLPEFTVNATCAPTLSTLIHASDRVRRGPQGPNVLLGEPPDLLTKWARWGG